MWAELLEKFHFEIYQSVLSINSVSYLSKRIAHAHIYTQRRR
jgi:hypothetical protein